MREDFSLLLLAHDIINSFGDKVIQRTPLCDFFLTFFCCCSREVQEQSPKPRSLLTTQYSITYTHGKRRVAAVKGGNSSVGSLPINIF